MMLPRLTATLPVQSLPCAARVRPCSDLVCDLVLSHRLLAKHTLETGLASKTAAENELLKTANAQLTAESTRLAEQVRGLSDELNAMHAAWADRDVKQRMQDAELKEVSRQREIKRRNAVTLHATTHCALWKGHRVWPHRPRLKPNLQSPQHEPPQRVPTVLPTALCRNIPDFSEGY
eukprot:scaffold51682_cov20-Tisochrysis_lutea.AAC.3